MFNTHLHLCITRIFNFSNSAIISSQGNHITLLTKEMQQTSNLIYPKPKISMETWDPLTMNNHFTDKTSQYSNGCT
jgi:hypothetical protein